jgi:crossover junction endodeoxyribonuclease RuvC
VFVLGVDPGLSRCGYCVLELGRSHRGRSTTRAVALGVLRTDPALPVPQRLAELAEDVRGLLDERPPAAVAVERVLFQVNVRTAMGVGQASGVVMAEAARRGIEVVEYSPNQVKDTVAGHGGADKQQVQRMVQILLELPAPPEPPDAADAAAIALTHAAVLASTRPARPAVTPPTAVRAAAPTGGAS